MKDSVVQVFTETGMAVGVGEVIDAHDEGDGRLYVLGEDGTHTVFNMRFVTHYVVRPYNPEEKESANNG
ncbi:hypothetical protein PBI_RHYNO_47 [Mycobacterium phage RhynO]|uniref:hypothetical protein n=1 Tax=Mycobacterium phage RhynO TaxID=1458846 RepID=UPI0003F20A15|nr:hypothetical protein CG97_gp35 [Mycobacterium phage RhynO]AHJ88705.1 hypothetical protein PBI_RHYNO_47 [Mycobacterium phage RhynO]